MNQYRVVGGVRLRIAGPIPTGDGRVAWEVSKPSSLRTRRWALVGYVYEDGGAWVYGRGRASVHAELHRELLAEVCRGR